jgi:hypothetical protein
MRPMYKKDETGRARSRDRNEEKVRMVTGAVGAVILKEP